MRFRNKITGTGADYSFRKTQNITPNFLKNRGIKGLILDVDNTLTTDENPVPPESIVKWLETMRKNGIKLIIVSNNHDERVRVFAEPLGLDYVCESLKPSKKGYTEAMQKMGLEPHEVAGVGDQLFTDVWGANFSGITSIYVQPMAIEGKEKRFILFKRKLEKPFLPVKYFDDKL